MKHKIILTLLSFLILPFAPTADACTSAIVSAKASADGRPFIWKHRDTGTEHNFIERVSTPGCLTYVGLFDGGDSLLTSAWLGMNEAGFMIINTASYNLAPDTAAFKDQEGRVMRRALEICRSVDDFRNLLDTLPRPMGVQANFGVLDRNGEGGYFEADDYAYTPYLLNDTTTWIVRTNYSFSGNDTDGYGYIRYDNARHLLCDTPFAPSMFTEGLSRSFYHSLLDRDMASPDAGCWVIDQDFIPRHSTAASVVMVGAPLASLTDSSPVMYAALGYTPVAELYRVTLQDVPDAVRPLQPGYRAEACNRAIERKRLAFPISRGSGPHYIDMHYLRPLNDSLRLRNLKIIAAQPSVSELIEAKRSGELFSPKINSRR